jgi:hypothetical protein
MVRPLLAFVCLACALSGSAALGQESSKKSKGTKEELLPPQQEAPGKVWIAPENYKTLYKELLEAHKKALDEIAELRRQLGRTSPSSCKLTGRLEGDALLLQAEFRFATQLPNTSVFLGLKNGYLADDGTLDDTVAHPEATKDGFSLRVPKDGPHRLTLSLKVPAIGKRASSSGNERGADLGLPGAAVTTLRLSLPATVKDFRWNEVVAPPRSPGEWDIALGALDSLSLSWREPITGSPQALAPSARATIEVKLDEGRLELSGKMVLEDPRLQIRDWQILLPPTVKIAATSETTPPVIDSTRAPLHSIRLTEPREKLTLDLQGQYARTQSQQRIPIGPFLVQGTNVQSTILVKAAPGVLRGQRLIYNRFGETFQHDPPKATPPLENLAYFQVFNAQFGGKGLSPAKAALELEWKMDKGQIEAASEHEVKFRKEQSDWLVEIETKFTLHSPSSGQDTVELQTSAAGWPDLFRFAPSFQAIPATLLAADLLGPKTPTPVPGGVSAPLGVKDIEPAADGSWHWHLKLARAIDKEIEFKVRTRAVLPGDAARFNIELPRLTGVLDRGGKATVVAPPGQEFMVGPVGHEEQPIRDKFQQRFDQVPASIELAWRPGGRERFAQALLDVVVRDHFVKVRERLTLIADDSDKDDARQIALVVPSANVAIDGFAKPERGRLWVPRPAANLAGKIDIDLTYRVPIDRLADGKAPIKVPIVWPDGANRKEAKVRLWTEANLAPRLVDMGRTWIESDLENVPGMTSFPAIVVTSRGEDPTLGVQLEEAGSARLPAMVCQRSLVQARIGENGNQSIQLRFLVKRFGGSFLEMDLPVPMKQAELVVRVAGKEIAGVREVQEVKHRVHIPLEPQLYEYPTVLEILYQAPAEEGTRSWQTPLALPRGFSGDVYFGPTRYQVSLGPGEVPFVFGTADVDYRWTLQGSLFGPEPNVTTAELDLWIGGGETAERRPVSLAWWRGSLEPQRVYHFSRQSWLLVSSGAVVLLGLGLLLIALPRWALALVLLGLGVAAVGLGMTHDYLMPVILFGSEPAIVVLLLIGGIQWLLHERYRRQLVFMPTFARVPAGSTVVRTPAKPREPSTVDAPPNFLGPAAPRGSAS